MVRSDVFLGVAGKADARLLRLFRFAGLVPPGLAVVLVILAAMDSLTHRPGVTAPTRLLLEDNGFGFAIAVAAPLLFGSCGLVSVLVTAVWVRRWPVHVFFFAPWFMGLMWVLTAIWPMYGSSIIEGPAFVPWLVRAWSLVYLGNACVAVGLGFVRRGRSPSFSPSRGTPDDAHRGRTRVWDGHE